MHARARYDDDEHKTLILWLSFNFYMHIQTWDVENKWKSKFLSCACCCEPGPYTRALKIIIIMLGWMAMTLTKNNNAKYDTPAGACINLA